jgi:hypothetical protein
MVKNRLRSFTQADDVNNARKLKDYDAFVRENFNHFRFGLCQMAFKAVLSLAKWPSLKEMFKNTPFYLISMQVLEETALNEIEAVVWHIILEEKSKIYYETGPYNFLLFSALLAKELMNFNILYLIQANLLKNKQFKDNYKYWKEEANLRPISMQEINSRFDLISKTQLTEINYNFYVDEVMLKSLQYKEAEKKGTEFNINAEKISKNEKETKLANEKRIAKEKKIVQEKKIAHEKKIAQEKKIAHEKKVVKESKVAQQMNINVHKIDQRRENPSSLIERITGMRYDDILPSLPLMSGSSNSFSNRNFPRSKRNDSKRHDDLILPEIPLISGGSGSFSSFNIDQFFALESGEYYFGFPFGTPYMGN